mgnify:CR=1 FL=1
MTTTKKLDRTGILLLWHHTRSHGKSIVQRDRSELVTAPHDELLRETREGCGKRGVGIQQICFQVDDINELINKLLDSGITMIDEKPRIGSKNCLIAFVHPKSTGGVLVELSQKQ